jgi:hypothetical protein
MDQLSWTWIGAGIAAFAVFAALLWWFVPKLQMRSIVLGDPKARADIEDNFRKTVGQALGGIAVLIGAGVAYLQFLQQQQAARDLLISNQVGKGFEQMGQMGSDKMVLRLGGIYALEGVMNVSEQYHQPVLEALCAYVREGTKMQEDLVRPPATDIQAALTVIGRRAPGPGQVDLTAANIPLANLIGANLTGANLHGVNLTNAELYDANLTGAHLTAAQLTGVKLTDANLTGAYLIGARLGGAYFVGANLTNASLDNSELVGAHLSYANLTGDNLDGADLTDAGLGWVLNLTQVLLGKACGKPKELPAGLTLDKPCPPRPVAPALNAR